MDLDTPSRRQPSVPRTPVPGDEPPHPDDAPLHTTEGAERAPELNDIPQWTTLGATRQTLDELLEAVAHIDELDPAGTRIEALVPGMRIGRFELVRELGRGGFGLVFEARDTALGRRVALKFLAPRGSPSGQPKLLALFRRETEIAARLSHPGIVTLHDYGEWEGIPYIVMEHLEGEALSAVLKRGPLTPLRALDVAIELAEALVYAHAAGVVHRDLKPSNLIVVHTGRIKVLDFGIATIAHVLHADEVAPQDATHGMGTPSYMAPEQRRGETEDARTDLFAAGVVLYELLTGRVPYATKSGAPPHDSTAALARSSVVFPASLPSVLRPLLMRGVSAAPEARYGSAADWLTALRGVRAAIAGRPKRWRRRAYAALLAALVALAVFLSVPERQPSRTSEQPAPPPPSALVVLEAAQRAREPRVAALLLAELRGQPEPPGGVALALRVSEQALPISVLTGAHSPLTAMAVSSARGRVFATTRQGHVLSWRIDGRGAVSRLPGELAVPTCIVASPDGRWVAAGAEDGRVWVWRLGDGNTTSVPQAALPLQGHTGPIQAVAFAREGARLLSTSRDGTTRLWNVDGGAPAVVLRGGLLSGWSSDGKRVVTVSARGRVRTFDVASVRGGGAPHITFESPASGPVVVAAITRQGTHVALGARDGGVRLVELSASGAPRRLGAHEGPVEALAFSADGAWLFSGSADRTARLWSVQRPSAQRYPSAQPLAQEVEAPRVLYGHTRRIRSVALCADGRHAVTASDDHTARIWDLARVDRSTALEGHAGAVISARFTQDGAHVVTGSADGQVRVWPARGALNPRSFGKRPAAAGPGGYSFPTAVWTARFSPDGAQVATGDGQGRVQLWRADGQGKPRLLGRHGERVTDLRFSRDGRRLVSASADGVVHVYAFAESGAPRTLELRGHAALVRTAAFSPDGRLVVTASSDHTARVVALSAPEAPTVLRGHTAPLVDARFSPDGRFIATASWDGTARIWRVNRAMDLLTTLPAGGSPLTGVEWSTAVTPGLGLVTHAQNGSAHAYAIGGNDAVSPTALPPGTVTPGNEGTVRIRAAAAPQPNVVRVPPALIPVARRSPDGRTVAVLAGDNTVRLFDASTGAPGQVLRGHTATLTALDWDTRSTRLLSASHDGAVRVWTLAAMSRPLGATAAAGSAPVVLSTSKKVGGAGAPVYLQTAFDPTGKQVVGTALDGTVRVWALDGASPPKVLQGHRASVTSVAFSPNAATLATSSLDHTARLWSLGGGAPHRVLKGHAHRVNEVQFDPLGTRVVTASQDGTLRVWPLAADGPPTSLRGHTGPVIEGRFSRDGSRIISASLDGTARIWSARGEPLHTLQGSGGAVYCAVFGVDGRQVITGSADGRVRIWNALDGTLARTLLGHRAAVIVVTVGRRGRHVLSVSIDGTARLWPLEVAAGAPASTEFVGHERILWNGTFSPDEQHVLTASDDGTARIFRADATGQPIVLRGDGAAFTYAVFDPKGERVAVAAGDGRVHVWVVGWAALLEHLKGATRGCLSVPERTTLLGEPESVARARHERCDLTP